MNENDINQRIEFRNKLYNAKEITNETIDTYKNFLQVLKNNVLVDENIIYHNDFYSNLDKLENTIHTLNYLLSKINKQI